MKAILFFVAAGLVRDTHRETAAKIAETTGKRVVFRNASSAAQSGEKPEPNEGVAGAVPAPYAAFPRFDEAGQLVSKGDAPEASTSPAERKLNAIGLPDGEGCPEDRESLKAALDAEGIEFHGNAKTDKLADLYLAHFYPETGEGNGQG